MGSTVFPGATVEITDPTHPLYGLIFPLAEVANKPHLGRACVVWLHPGVARLIPLAATDLGGGRLPLARCRLSVEGLRQLLTAVSSLEARAPEDVHVRRDFATPAGGPAQPAVAVALGATPGLAAEAPARAGGGAGAAGLATAGAADAAVGPADVRPRAAGGAP